MVPGSDRLQEQHLQEQIVAFIRAFGLHRPDRTACGEPVSVSEAYALMELHTGEAISQNELAERLGLEKSTVSRLVQQLEMRAWLKRDKDPVDSRILRLRLTSRGRKAAGRLARARSDKFARVLAGIPHDRRDDVARALDILAEAAHAAR